MTDMELDNAVRGPKLPGQMQIAVYDEDNEPKGVVLDALPYIDPKRSANLKSHLLKYFLPKHCSLTNIKIIQQNTTHYLFIKKCTIFCSAILFLVFMIPPDKNIIIDQKYNTEDYIAV